MRLTATFVSALACMLLKLRWLRVSAAPFDDLYDHPDYTGIDGAAHSEDQSWMTPYIFEPTKKCPPGTTIEDHRCGVDRRLTMAIDSGAYRVVCTTAEHYRDRHGRMRPRLSYVTLTGSCPADHVCMPYGHVLMSKRRRKDSRPPTKIACVARDTFQRQTGVRPHRVRRTGSRRAPSIAAAAARTTASHRDAQPRTATHAALDDTSVSDTSWLDTIETVASFFDDSRTTGVSAVTADAPSIASTSTAAAACPPDLTPYRPTETCPPGTLVEDHRCFSNAEGDLRTVYAVVCFSLQERWEGDLPAKPRAVYKRLVGHCPDRHVCISLDPTALYRRRRTVQDRAPPTRIACTKWVSLPRGIELPAGYMRGPRKRLAPGSSSAAPQHCSRANALQTQASEPPNLATASEPAVGLSITVATPPLGDDATWADSMIVEHAAAEEGPQAELDWELEGGLGAIVTPWLP